MITRLHLRGGSILRVDEPAESVEHRRQRAHVIEVVLCADLRQPKRRAWIDVRGIDAVEEAHP